MSAGKFRKILVANRGEIALRIMRTCRQMGIQTVAIHSATDAHAPFVQYADETVRLEGSTLPDTYLNGQRILEIAKEIGADAIHPGYGFLSENADFSAACTSVPAMLDMQRSVSV